MVNVYFGRKHPNFLFEDRTRNLLIILFFCLLLISAFFSMRLLSRVSQDAPKLIDSTNAFGLRQVLIPIRNIDQFAQLEPSMFREEQASAQFFSQGFLTSLQELKGRYAKTLIIKGHPLHQDFLSDVRPIESIRFDIPDDYRAVTIGVDKFSSVEGWVKPGVRVDTVWLGNRENKLTLLPLLDNLKVLSVEGSLNAREGAGGAIPGTVTLLTKAGDDQLVHLALAAGKISLSLRGESDAGHSGWLKGRSIDDLFNRASLAKDNTDSLGIVRLGERCFRVRANADLEPVTQDDDVPVSLRCN